MILVNGELTPQANGLDRGLAYGDGVFRTMPWIEGRIPHWHRHFAKLKEDCERLALACPEQDALYANCEEVGAEQGIGVIKVIVTRGSAGRGYAYPAAPKHTLIVASSTPPLYPEHYRRNGVTVRLCNLVLSEQPALAGIKHLNRLENVLARAEWNDPGIAEGILLDRHGNIVEGVMSNVFLVLGRRLVTPDLTRCGVAGVTRTRILDWAKCNGITVEVRDVPYAELFKADEVFLCNSLIGLWPVRELAGRTWKNDVLTPEIQTFLLKPDD